MLFPVLSSPCLSHYSVTSLCRKLFTLLMLIASHVVLLLCNNQSSCQPSNNGSSTASITEKLMTSDRSSKVWGCLVQAANNNLLNAYRTTTKPMILIYNRHLHQPALTGLRPRQHQIINQTKTLIWWTQTEMETRLIDQSQEPQLDLYRREETISLYLQLRPAPL